MSLIEFNFEKKSEYYTDPKIKKARLISKIMFFVGIILIIGSIFLFQDKEIDDTKALLILQPPFPFIIVGLILLIVSGIITKVAMLKSAVKSFKTDDNPFFKEKENITNEINEKKKEFDNLKNAFDEMNNNNKDE